MVAWRRRSTGKKGREGLFFNHHQLGLATKEVTRLAATATVARHLEVVVYWVVAFHLATHNSLTPLFYGPSTL